MTDAKKYIIIALNLKTEKSRDEDGRKEVACSESGMV